MKTNRETNWLIKKDLDEVIRIDRSVYEYGWSEEDFIHYLKTPSCIGLTCKDTKTGELCGYVVYLLRREYIEVIRLGVHLPHRRRGVATVLVEKLLYKLQHSSPKKQLEICVPESSLSMQLLLKRLGFKATGEVERDYIEGKAYRMVFNKVLEPVNG